MSYILSVLIIVGLVFVIVKNTFAIIQKIKDKKAEKQKENTSDITEVQSDLSDDKK